MSANSWYSPSALRGLQACPCRKLENESLSVWSILKLSYDNERECSPRLSKYRCVSFQQISTNMDLLLASSKGTYMPLTKTRKPARPTVLNYSSVFSYFVENSSNAGVVAAMGGRKGRDLVRREYSIEQRLRRTSTKTLRVSAQSTTMMTFSSQEQFREVQME